MGAIFGHGSAQASASPTVAPAAPKVQSSASPTATPAERCWGLVLVRAFLVSCHASEAAFHFNLLDSSIAQM